MIPTMLKALLHRKLGRAETHLATLGQEEGDGDVRDLIVRLEDPLTSSVFERFVYLNPRFAWRLLTESSGQSPPLSGPCPEGEPSWAF